MAIEKQFVVQRQGRDFVLYAGLVAAAHTQGLRRITTQLIQAPTEANGNMAIVHAQVETDLGVFDGLGDASPANVGKMIAPHALRMAETRAKARALRDALNVGMAVLEELADEAADAGPAHRSPAPQRPTPPAPAPATPPTLHAQVIDPNGPAPAEAYVRIRELAAESALYGHKVEVPHGMTYGEALALHRDLKATIEQLRAERQVQR